MHPAIKIILVFLMILTACQQEPKSTVIEIDIDKALRTSGSFKLSDLIADAEIITLDTVKESFFMNVMSLEITEQFMCFTCNTENKVYLFNRQGKFIRNIGYSGKGPGEYVSPNIVAVSPDEKYVVVGDEAARKLILYTIGGQFIRERKTAEDSPGFSIGSVTFVDASDFIVAFRRPGNPTIEFASILRYDLNFKVVGRILPRSGSEEEAMPNLSFQTLMRTETGFAFWETFKDTIYYIDKQGVAKPAFHFLVKNHCQDSERGQSVGNSETCTQVMNVLDLPGHLILSIMQNGEARTVVYDKASNQASSADHPIACEVKSNSWVKSSMVNDVFGIEPVHIEQFIPVRNEVISMVRPGWTIDTHDFTCLRNREVTLPAIRDRLADICQSGSVFEDMVILVLKLK